MARLFVEALTVIDCAYLDGELGLLGESWIVDLELGGKLDEQGMVQDFGTVKRTIKQAIDDAVDHRLLLPSLHPGLEIRRDDERVRLRFEDVNGDWIEHASPPSAILEIDADRVTRDSVSKHLLSVLRGRVAENVEDIKLSLRHEIIDGAWYRYCHGLRKHDGACQRIAHGHRSRLHILVDGQRDESLEIQRAKAWENIYLGSRSDLVKHADGRLHFAYQARDGAFELSLPDTRCDLIDTDSTVENLAEAIALRAQQARPGHKIEARAYEGVKKGAIATAG